MILVYGVLLALILTIGTLLFRQWAQQAGPVRTQQVLRRSGFAILAGIAAILLLRSGAALLALMAALLPFMRRLLPWVLTLAPVLRRHLRTGGSSSGAASTPHRSTVNTRFLSMTLDHQDGRMSGRVLEGPHQGRELNDMTLSELMGLYGTCRSDPQSSAVLRAYLDRMHPDWRQYSSDSGPRDESVGDHHMSIEEAREILGVSSDASREEIVQAHRRLMQKFHPDRGGNDYLAARINRAKTILVERN